MKSIIIYTDGAVPNNQSKIIKTGGIGVFFGENDQNNISFKLKETPSTKVTNMVCETLACIMALETLVSTQQIKNSNIIIKTDSMYIVNSMTIWAKSWEENNWIKSDGKPVQNVELIKKLYYLSRNMNVTYTHVKAHRKAPPLDSNIYIDYYGNYMADKLATNAATNNYK